MQARVTIISICVLLGTVDCAWNADPNSDAITGSAGESVANMQVQQAREIWPARSLDRDITFEARRFLPQGDSSAKQPADGPVGTESNAGKTQQ